MPQLHLYVPESVAEELRRRAGAEGLSTSKYLATLVERDLEAAWPSGWFDRVLGRWEGDLERAPQGEPELRQSW